MVTLQTVEVPGFREAVRKERIQRDRAFLGGDEIVCGVTVRQLSLRTLLYLEHAENGFVIRFRFDDDNEVMAHALQVLYFSSVGWTAPSVERFSFWSKWLAAWKQQRFIRSVMRRIKPDELIREVQEWMDASFMDCPAGNPETKFKPSHASHPAYLVDMFAEAGLYFTYEEIMDMPLKRLWQHWRLAAARVHGLSLTNPSDVLATQHLAKGGV